MTVRLTSLAVFIILAFSNTVKAQGWKIKSYDLAFKMFEICAVGNNPISITPLLKNPVAYQRYLNTIKVNSLVSNPEILRLHTLYINAEWQKDNPALKFWKKYSLQGGILLTSKIVQEAGAIGEESYLSSIDTSMHINMYSLTKNQQLFGANMGLNRRFTLSNKLNFVTGLHVQGSFALLHHYQQQWDSSTYTPSGGWTRKTNQFPNLEAKNFFQWQLMIPFGLEYEFIKKQFFVRLELNAGIVRSRYRPRDLTNSEAHGAGIWLVFKPKTEN